MFILQWLFYADELKGKPRQLKSKRAGNWVTINADYGVELKRTENQCCSSKSTCTDVPYKYRNNRDPYHRLPQKTKTKPIENHFTPYFVMANTVNQGKYNLCTKFNIGRIFMWHFVGIPWHTGDSCQRSRTIWPHYHI